MKKLFLSLFVIFTFIGLYSCDSTSTEPEEGGKISLYLTDAPGDYEEVNITFSEVSAHIDSEWITVVGEPITVNLLDYSNGNSFLMGSEDVPAGKYTQVRLWITSASLVVNGETYNLIVPSGKLRFGPEFTIEPGMNYEMVIDFDASRSIVEQGNNNFKLKPRVRVLSKAVTGSITGIVLNCDDQPAAYAIQDTDTITTSFVKENGEFVLSFLNEGSYTVVVEDTLQRNFTAEGINVTNGVATNLGDITLQ